MKNALVYILICGIGLLGGCVNLRLKKDFTLDEEDWYTEGGDSRRSHEVMAAIDPPLVEKWRYDIGAGTGLGGALVVDEVVLVGNRKGQVLALDLNSGKRLGRARFDSPIEGGMSYGDDALFIPMIAKKKTIVAYDITTGEQRWRLNTTPIESSLLVSEQVLITVDIDGFIKGLDTETGDMLWEEQLGERTGVISSPVLVGAHVAVANEQGIVSLFDAQSGEKKWSSPAESPVQASLSSNGSQVFVSTTRGRLLSMFADTGAHEWVYALADTTVRFAAPGFDEQSGLLVVGSSDGMIRALDSSNGAVRWETALEGAVIIAPLFTQNTVYIGTLRGKVYALDKGTGEKIWEHKVTGRVKSAMAAHGEKLVVLSETQQLFVFEPEQPGEEISPQVR